MEIYDIYKQARVNQMQSEFETRLNQNSLKAIIDNEDLSDFIYDLIARVEELEEQIELGPIKGEKSNEELPQGKEITVKGTFPGVVRIICADKVYPGDCTSDAESIGELFSTTLSCRTFDEVRRVLNG